MNRLHFSLTSLYNMFKIDTVNDRYYYYQLIIVIETQSSFSIQTILPSDNYWCKVVIPNTLSIPESDAVYPRSSQRALNQDKMVIKDYSSCFFLIYANSNWNFRNLGLTWISELLANANESWTCLDFGVQIIEDVL